MKTILVPVDFSEVSHNASKFAAALAEKAGDTRLLLYNMFESYLPGSDSSPLFEDIEDRRNIRLAALNNIRKELLSITSVPIECKADDGTSLSHNIKKIIVNEMADLVVMGITGSTRLEQILVGSNTLNLIRSAQCPILVIPPHAIFGHFKKVVMAVDLESEIDTLPKKRIEAMLKLFPAELHIVYVNPYAEAGLDAEQEFERKELETWLAPYRPQFHSLVQKNFVKALNKFVIDNDIDLLLTVPHKISYVADLFTHTHSERLGYHSKVPFIAVHE